MKKNILVFSFAFLIINVFSFNAQAQENEKPKAKKLGFEFFISGNHNLVKEDRLGLGGGINFVIRKDKPIRKLSGLSLLVLIIIIECNEFIFSQEGILL